MRLYSPGDTSLHVTVRLLCEQFVEFASLTIATRASYRSRLLGSRSISSVFGDIDPELITQIELHKFLKSKKQKPVSAKTELNTIKHAWSWGLSTGLLRTNPLDGFTPYFEDRIRDPLTNNEFFAINKHAGNGCFRRILWFIWLTGCRPGEARALQFTDIRNGVAYIQHHKTRRHRKNRHLYLSQRAAKLVEYCERHRIDNQSFVFICSTGKPWKKDALCGQMNRTCKRAKILGKSLYCARHSYLTAAAEVLPLAKVQRLAGHSNITTTQRYLHFEDVEDMKDSADKVR